MVVTCADGSTIRFAVQWTQQVDKRRFPTDDLLLHLAPTLRLVTCGGTCNATASHDRSNIIVYAAVRA
jgi:hypothetical protein